MRFSIDLDDKLGEKLDKEAKKNFRSRKSQTEFIIQEYFSDELKDTLHKITKSNDSKALLKKL